MLISKPLINIEICSFPLSKKEKRNFISSTPFCTVTETPKFLYVAIIDFQNNIIYTGRMFIKKYPQTPAAMRGAIRMFIKEFCRQFNLIKIKNITFTRVDDSPVTEVIRLVIGEFKKYKLVK